MTSGDVRLPLFLSEEANPSGEVHMARSREASRGDPRDGEGTGIKGGGQDWCGVLRRTGSKSAVRVT